MNIILGASGQVGSIITETLHKDKKALKAVIRDENKANSFSDRGIEVAIADFHDRDALEKALVGGNTVFIQTPENPMSEDIIKETKEMLSVFREAISNSEVKRIIGLSSIGAQHQSGTGNLKLSYMLEKAFEDLPQTKIFVRPSYYFSNWMGYFETAKDDGILPTFFPGDLKIPMVSPVEVGEFIAKLISDEIDKNKIFELVGPEYSTADVASAFGKMLKKRVEVQQIPKEQWKETLMTFGFSEISITNMIEMIEAVIDRRATPETSQSEWVKPSTNFEKYLAEQLK